VGQVCGASCSPFDLLDIALRFLTPLRTLGWAALDRPQLLGDEGSVVEDYSEQVIEVMCDTTSEASEHLEALALDDLGLPWPFGIFSGEAVLVESGCGLVETLQPSGPPPRDGEQADG
jgi:hypothetical protein